MALLGWSEEEFWAATPFGLYDAVREYRRIHGIETEQDKRRAYIEWRNDLEEGLDVRRREAHPLWADE